MATPKPLPANGAQLFDTAVFNAQVPKEGPKAASLLVPFSTGQDFKANLLLTQSQQFMSMVQAIFIDNAKNSAPVSVTSDVINQTVVMPPKSQGYLPLLVAKNGGLTFHSEGGVDISVVLLNVPVPAIVWDASDGGAQYVPVAASTTQALGTDGGAIGDYLDGLLIIPATLSPGSVSISDGATTITLFAGGASSVTTLIPFWVPINATSKLAGWSVTTGAAVSVLANGSFT